MRKCWSHSALPRRRSEPVSHHQASRIPGPPYCTGTDFTLHRKSSLSEHDLPWGRQCLALAQKWAPLAMVRLSTEGDSMLLLVDKITVRKIIGARVWLFTTIWRREWRKYPSLAREGSGHPGRLGVCSTFLPGQVFCPIHSESGWLLDLRVTLVTGPLLWGHSQWRRQQFPLKQ